MDTDALLAPVVNVTDKEPIAALKALVEANTAAWKEIRTDLTTCNNDEKMKKITAKVEKAMTDLAIDSQKVPQWLRGAKDEAPIPPFYGQYPINDPFNPFNPVPWPPGYIPPSEAQGG